MLGQASSSRFLGGLLELGQFFRSQNFRQIEDDLRLGLGFEFNFFHSDLCDFDKIKSPYRTNSKKKVAIWRIYYYLSVEMNKPTEVTAENLKTLRRENKMSQEQVGAILGVGGNQVSKIEKGVRALAPSEAALLNLYFFETLPFKLNTDKDLASSLNFSFEEWQVICTLATKKGQNPSEWIKEKIQDYLAFNDEARALSARYPKVAENEAPYRAKASGN